MNNILARIQAAQKANPVLQKAANGGVITDESEKSADVATDLVEGATNIPDVTKDPNTAPIADIGDGPEHASDEVTPAAPVDANETNPDVQEILDAKETIVKTANALLHTAQAFSQLSIAEIDAMFNKQASAEELTNEQAIDMINKFASAGNPVATAFVDFCNGYTATLQKIANDAEALIAQGVAPEEAEAIAAQAAMGGDIPMEATEEVATEAGAELEAAVAEITAEAAKEIMEVVPEASPEEAQALAEELVAQKLSEENGAVEGMEQTASADEPSVEEPSAEEPVVEDVPAEATEDIESALAKAIDELKLEAAKELLEVMPEADPAEAAELASELVDNKLAEELGAMEGMEQTASAEEVPATEDAPVEVPNEAVAEAEEVVNELITATAEDIKASAPEVSDEEAVQLATEAVMDAVAVAQEQEAIGATDENGEYVVPDEVAAESIEDMIKTASDNPLRDALTPVVATLFGVDQNAFINRFNK